MKVRMGVIYEVTLELKRKCIRHTESGVNEGAIGF